MNARLAALRAEREGNAMPADFVAALRAEIAALEAALATDPRFRTLDLLQRALALYEDGISLTLPPEPPARLAASSPAPQPAPPRLCAREGCGKPIPPGRRRDGRYCSNQCRQTANNQKRVRSDTGTEIRYWTPAEDEVLRRRWPSEPHGPIAIDLRRSYGACEQRARKLGIKGPGQRSNFRRASEGGLGSTDLAQPEPGTEEIIEPAETAPEPQPEPAATKTAPAAPQSEVDRFVATKGVTVCPPAYVEMVADASRLNPLPALVRDETTGKWRRADAG